MLTGSKADRRCAYPRSALGIEDLRPEVFGEYVQAAVELNRSLGDPTKG
jgi:hypothetical protein